MLLIEMKQYSCAGATWDEGSTCGQGEDGEEGEEDGSDCGEEDDDDAPSRPQAESGPSSGTAVRIGMA